GPHTREALAEEAPYYAELLSRPGAARSALEPLRNLVLSRAETAALDKPVTVPVLSVQGELDPVQPAQAYARDTHHVAGNLRQVTVHRSGHFPQEETSAGFVRALLPFLADVAPPASA
uniref:alpha/beta fold hydrolase n=1 Tax=Actinomyces oris TaxID=544580 RepID=UPI002852BA97